MRYKRILLKLSGEALQGGLGYGIDGEVINALASEISEIHKFGIEIGIVIGGGNIFRGVKGVSVGMDRVAADHMGMLATVINSLALQDYLEQQGRFTRVQTAINVEDVAEPFIRRRAIRHLEKGRIVIFAAGTGNPYFTTDTAAALRAVEIEADVIIKGTKVDGVYDCDPVKDKNAKKYETLTHLDVVKNRLKVIDSTAVTLCMENKLPIIIFNITKKGNLKRLLIGEKIGTTIGSAS